MLIEFSVSNFRSIREQQTLSMVASSKLPKKENVFAPAVFEDGFPQLLKTVAVYGGNASGKSTLMMALRVICMVASRAPGASARLPVVPFRHDKNLLDKPSCFEIHFITQGMRYQFELSMTQDRIVEERLIAYPNGVATIWYSRKYSDESGDSYHFTDDLDANKTLREAWTQLTGPKTLFLAQAVANSSESLTQLRPALNWLAEGMLCLENGMSRMAAVAQDTLREVPSLSEEISEFLYNVDIPVTSIKVEKVTKSVSARGLLAPITGKISEENGIAEGGSGNKSTFTHRTMLGDADFDFSEESRGTQELVGFWLPWSMMESKSAPFEVMIVDELDSSLHPEIVASLIREFLKGKSTRQLIFTTHDTHLMDTKILRRDQIWLTERDVNGATQVRSVHDFVGRESEDVEKRYYEGKYRALPIIRKN